MRILDMRDRDEIEALAKLRHARERFKLFDEWKQKYLPMTTDTYLAFREFVITSGDPEAVLHFEREFLPLLPPGQQPLLLPKVTVLQRTRMIDQNQLLREIAISNLPFFKRFTWAEFLKKVAISTIAGIVSSVVLYYFGFKDGFTLLTVGIIS